MRHPSGHHRQRFRQSPGAGHTTRRARIWWHACRHWPSQHRRTGPWYRISWRLRHKRHREDPYILHNTSNYPSLLSFRISSCHHISIQSKQICPPSASRSISCPGRSRSYRVCRHKCHPRHHHKPHRSRPTSCYRVRVVNKPTISSPCSHKGPRTDSSDQSRHSPWRLCRSVRCSPGRSLYTPRPLS